VSIRLSTATSLPGMEIAYGWVFQTKNAKVIVWHNGATPGYRTYVGFDPKHQISIVVLSNRFSPTLPDDIGRHLLDQSLPIAVALGVSLLIMSLIGPLPTSRLLDGELKTR